MYENDEAESEERSERDDELEFFVIKEDSSKRKVALVSEVEKRSY